MITLALAAVAFYADGITTKFVPTGATARSGGYSPIRSNMATTQPKSIKKLPAGVTGGRFGTMTFGEANVDFLLTEDKVFVDSNHDGDLSNDAAATWEKRANNTWFGAAKADIGRGEPVGISFYHFDEADATRAALKDVMLYYGDFGYEITITMDGKASTAFVAGEVSENTTLWIDRDENKKRSNNYEVVRMNQPFNFSGTTYVVSKTDKGLTLEKSATSVDKTPMPPDFTNGVNVLNFKAKTIDGTEINFPSSYKGKVVLLDFWATWCGPCLAEMPNVVGAYKAYHDKGFDILGISFDREAAEDAIKTTSAKFEMTWPHVYEGKYWTTTIGKQFDVSSIPFAVLVDGTTGKILGSGNELRGKGLENALAKFYGK